jgi:hypothetical protein
MNKSDEQSIVLFAGTALGCFILLLSIWALPWSIQLGCSFGEAIGAPTPMICGVKND